MEAVGITVVCVRKIFQANCERQIWSMLLADIYTSAIGWFMDLNLNYDIACCSWIIAIINSLQPHLNLSLFRWTQWFVQPAQFFFSPLPSFIFHLSIYHFFVHMSWLICGNINIMMKCLEQWILSDRRKNMRHVTKRRIAIRLFLPSGLAACKICWRIYAETYELLIKAWLKSSSS